VCDLEDIESRSTIYVKIYTQISSIGEDVNYFVYYEVIKRDLKDVVRQFFLFIIKR
jgi:hypothetical protein